MVFERIPLELTSYRPGANHAQRGSVACRPHHADWPLNNLRAVADVLVTNPYIKAQFGQSIKVSAYRAAGQSSLAFVVTDIAAPGLTLVIA